MIDFSEKYFLVILGVGFEHEVDKFTREDVDKENSGTGGRQETVDNGKFQCGIPIPSLSTYQLKI